MENLNVTDAQRVLFNLIGHNLFSKPLEINASVDWNAVIKESILQSLPLVAFKKFQDLSMDEATASNLQRLLKKIATNNINGYKAHEYLHKLMSENQVPYCIIKGAASAFRYPDPLLRIMGDVDFYVPQEHFDRAKEVFLAEGFEFDTSDHAFHLGMKKGTLHFEMHFAPIASPKGEIGDIFLEYWSDICQSARLTQDVFSKYFLPSDFHHGFILLTHLRSHLLKRGVGLRHACDWAVFVNSFSDEQFTEIFCERLKRVGLWRFAQVSALMAVVLFDMPYKAWMGDDYATARALAEEISSSGNFGSRDKNRSFATAFVSDSEYKSKHRCALARLFSVANSIVLRHWESAKKYPILYPIGWVYFALRFAFNRLTGRCDVNIVKSYEDGKKRTNLYRSLRFFEPET